MNTSELLADAFGRIKELVEQTAEGLTAEQLAYRPAGTGNSIAWLLWHLTRVQDAQVADVAGSQEIWTAQGWAGRFALPFDESEHGYGMSTDDVSKVRVDDPQLLVDYYDAVHSRSLEYVAGLSEADLDRVVDDRWDPPVTLGVRLISIIDDDVQHVGQAAYVRGILP
ncbi:DUF664 domain-containing protein [Kineosporia sp. J2-2]|uniref:DUF664 domain-containing protein n=1 Tax=Kineosporia corallincola TaxID=2835133 RepID=A0ABS5TMH5_9ACTN|nr:DUF664 domain-containing protein [Kineosporia corallincola]MBT0772296.1 DUF664 domain-containing protein [Kineosporia corallincola]